MLNIKQISIFRIFQFRMLLLLILGLITYGGAQKQLVKITVVVAVINVVINIINSHYNQCQNNCHDYPGGGI